MQLCVADSIFHRFSISIAVGLGNCFLTQLLHTAFGIFILGILQFYNVTVFHVGIDFQQWTEEYINIAGLRILFRNGAVKAVLGCHGKGEAVDKELPFLFVALRSVTFQAVGDVAEVSLPVATIGE